jgi:hypothetical protein
MEHRPKRCGDVQPQVDVMNILRLRSDSMAGNLLMFPLHRSQKTVIRRCEVSNFVFLSSYPDVPARDKLALVATTEVDLPDVHKPNDRRPIPLSRFGRISLGTRIFKIHT